MTWLTLLPPTDEARVIELITEVVDRLGGDVQLKQFVPTLQRQAIRFVGESLAAGKETIMLELAARFGKTGTQPVSV